jgi:hypothetical protein
LRDGKAAQPQDDQFSSSLGIFVVARRRGGRRADTFDLRLCIFVSADRRPSKHGWDGFQCLEFEIEIKHQLLDELSEGFFWAPPGDLTEGLSEQKSAIAARVNGLSI